jgi:hypothetical protein
MGLDQSEKRWLENGIFQVELPNGRRNRTDAGPEGRENAQAPRCGTECSRNEEWHHASQGKGCHSGRSGKTRRTDDDRERLAVGDYEVQQTSVRRYPSSHYQRREYAHRHFQRPEVSERAYSVATKRPADINRIPELLTEEQKYENAEDDLRLSPDGTMTTYHEFDEFDENSEWYKHPPKPEADLMSEEELAEIAALPDVPDD